ncbi:S8 family serine peptidase [Aminipila butyrica]|uniref:S8 family serine peptidase n=2 Tax=Aminipila butyrica TaxID=433296 RepID=A0A858BZ61_9FIRM|nr:S8 family serine peptidase [Aminipila butyrica]
MKAEQNKFPVYESPFDLRMNPGKWQKPNRSEGETESSPQLSDQNRQDREQNQKGNRFSNRNTRFSNDRLDSLSVMRQQEFVVPYSFTASGTLRKASTSSSAVAGIDINIRDAWAAYESQRNVTVAFIDTGIDYNHEDLSDIMWVNEDEIPDNGVDDDGNGYVDDIYGWNFYDNNNSVYVGEEDDHGTHGAGTIAATKDNAIGITGIADEDAISIMSLKALGGKDGSGTTESIMKAIAYAEANGASICNLSLGTTSYDKDLYEAMAKSKMLFIVAAGNGDDDGGTDIDKTPTYPAAFNLDNIISVANVSYDGALSSSSNYGEASVDIAAPGSYILSLTADNGYAYMSGTSMAAPMITGTAALLYSARGDWNLQQVREAILNTATPLSGLSGKVVSGGMLNAGAAMVYGRE